MPRRPIGRGPGRPSVGRGPGRPSAGRSSGRPSAGRSSGRPSVGRSPGKPLGRRPLVRRAIPGVFPPAKNRRGIPSGLTQAHQQLHSGQYQQSAKSFTDLAQKGISRGFRQAPNLFFQAARSYLMLGNLVLAMNLVKKAFDFFAHDKRWGDLYRGANRSSQFLSEQGYTDEAQQVETWAQEMIPPEVFQNLHTTSVRQEKKEIVLPVHCPSCGGTVNPREVEWVDENSAICDYCGSVIKGE